MLAMTESSKHLWDVALDLLTLAGGALAFWLGLRQWAVSQQWQRAEQLDKFVTEFESNDKLLLAATLLDWTDRKTQYGKQKLTIRNAEVLLALRPHTEMKPDDEDEGNYTGNQPLLRDAYDALLSFFVRLELALEGGLVDARAAGKYFRYWLERWMTMDRHGDDERVLKGRSPAEMAAAYTRAYGDPESLLSLGRRLGVATPPAWRARTGADPGNQL